MTRAIVVAGLLAILGGLFLAKRPDQPGLRLDHQDCIDPMSPSLNRQAAPRSLFVQIDWLLFHSGEVRL